MQKLQNLLRLYYRGGFSEVYRQYHEGILWYSPKAWLKIPSDVPLNKPVFFVGVQGGGMTVISRMLRRHKNAVSVTGSSNYWTGGDELAPRYPFELPKQLTPRFYFYEPFLQERVSHLGLNREQFSRLPPHLQLLYIKYGTFWWWNYASDDLLPFFKADKTDYNPQIARQFINLLKKIIFVNSSGYKTARLIDKSQQFSLKIDLLEHILERCEPCYIAVVRSPYAICYRVATSGYLADRPLSVEARLQIAAEHYNNTYQTILNSFEKLPATRIHLVKLEDFLDHPQQHLTVLCRKTGLEFSEDMLPQPYHKLPFGSPDRTKWYPLQSDVNKKYLEKLQKKQAKIIENVCGDLISRFAYQPES